MVLGRGKSVAFGVMFEPGYVYMSMRSNISPSHAVHLAVHYAPGNKKKEKNFRSSPLVPRAGVEPAQG